jgi:hypothetical protein
MITIRTFGFETGQQRPLVRHICSLAAAKSCRLRISTVVFFMCPAKVFRCECIRDVPGMRFPQIGNV